MNPSDFARQDDPLAAIGASLTAAAHRRSIRLRRRRRGLLAAVATTATLAVAGGAFAVTGTSTGVPVLDRWIGNATGPTARNGPMGLGKWSAPRPSTRPLGGFSPVVEIPAPGDEMIVAAGYSTRTRSICSVMLDRDDNSRDPRGGLGCLGGRLLQRELALRPARLGGGGGSPIRDAKPALALFWGVARGDVTGVEVGLPGRELVTGVVSDAWQPAGWNGQPLRVFFAVMPAPEIDRRRLAGRRPPLRDSIPDRVRARLADGTVVGSR